jgi:alanyl-tRNA synthetase
MSLTDRLYYNDSFLHEFDARVLSVTDAAGRTAVKLDRSAFYPASGGQNFDTGWLTLAEAADADPLRVTEVAEEEQTGEVLHIIEGDAARLQQGLAVRGAIDVERRRDHMQQHSGQHVLSAAFEKLYRFETVSFHMGDESCTIDLATLSVKPEQMRAAERLANEVVANDHLVEIRFATEEEARTMGVRKIPAAERERLRLIDISGFDLNACGGTHVHRTGQIGAILLRKTEKVRQGTRVEFVCGLRAIATARHDFETLTEAAALFSTHLYEVPRQIGKWQDEMKVSLKAQHRLVEELAELQAERLLQSAELRHGERLVVHYFADRDLVFLKMLAQKLAHSGHVLALLACGGGQPSLVFAQTPGSEHDVGALMKQTVQALGTRGGGTRDMAQGGAPDAASAERALQEAASAIG